VCRGEKAPVSGGFWRRFARPFHRPAPIFSRRFSRCIFFSTINFSPLNIFQRRILSSIFLTSYLISLKFLLRNYTAIAIPFRFFLIFERPYLAGQQIYARLFIISLKRNTQLNLFLWFEMVFLYDPPFSLSLPFKVNI
jgi:hypothetical protein